RTVIEYVAGVPWSTGRSSAVTRPPSPKAPARPRNASVLSDIMSLPPTYPLVLPLVGAAPPAVADDGGDDAAEDARLGRLEGDLADAGVEQALRAGEVARRDERDERPRAMARRDVEGRDDRRPVDDGEVRGDEDHVRPERVHPAEHLEPVAGPVELVR